MTSPSFSRGLPWMREMDSPGKNLPIACRPSVTMTRGRSTSRCRRSQTSQAATSSGSGSRFSGGRCRTTFVMNTFRRSRPIPARSSSRNWPAAPTNGLPCTSSWYPGASPKKNRPDSPVPSPGTAWRALRWSGQARQARISAATAFRSIGAASFTARDYGGRAAVLRWHFACCARRDGVGRDQRTHARLQSQELRQAWPADRPRSLSEAEAHRRAPSDWRRRTGRLVRDRPHAPRGRALPRRRRRAVPPRPARGHRRSRRRLWASPLRGPGDGRPRHRLQGATVRLERWRHGWRGRRLAYGVGVRAGRARGRARAPAPRRRGRLVDALRIRDGRLAADGGPLGVPHPPLEPLERRLLPSQVEDIRVRAARHVDDLDSESRALEHREGVLARRKEEPLPPAAREAQADGDELLRVGEHVTRVGEALLRFDDERTAFAKRRGDVPQDPLLGLERKEIEDVHDRHRVALRRRVGDHVSHLEPQPLRVADRAPRDLDLVRIEVDPEDASRVGGLTQYAGEEPMPAAEIDDEPGTRDVA